MINWKNVDMLIKTDELFVHRLIQKLETEIKYEQAHGLKGISNKELEDIKEFRKFAKANSIFSESHPILEDDLNLLEELKRIA